jgi:serine/threonine protein kinase
MINKKMGTQIYMAPEVHDAYNLPCRPQTTDIFSLGVLFFMLAFGAPPFHSAEISDGFFSFLKQRPDSLDFFKFHPHTRLLFREKKIPESFMRLLLAMLRAEPSQRIQDVSQLFEFDFFSQIDQELLEKTKVQLLREVEALR